MALHTLLEKNLKTSLCHIIESCFLIMQEKKINEITIEEIVSKAGVHRTTFYRNFNNKDEVIKVFFRCLLNEYLDTLYTKKPASIYEYGIIFFQSFYNYKNEVLLCYKNGLEHYIIEMYEQEYFKKYNQNSHTTLEELSIMYHYGGVHKVLRWWFSRGMQHKPEEIAKMITTMKGAKLLALDFVWNFG